MMQDVRENVFIFIANIFNNKMKIIVALTVIKNLFKCLLNLVQLAALDVQSFLKTKLINRYFESKFLF